MLVCPGAGAAFQGPDQSGVQRRQRGQLRVPREEPRERRWLPLFPRYLVDTDERARLSLLPRDAEVVFRSVSENRRGLEHRVLIAVRRADLQSGEVDGEDSMGACYCGAGIYA